MLFIDIQNVMRKNHFVPFLLCVIVGATLLGCATQSKTRLTAYVNPFLGTETLWDSVDLGFKPTFGPDSPFGEGKRIWGAETFPGSSLPNAMVQASPVTMYGSGSGYQYEDTLIFGFTHTNKGHWNLCNVPLLPVTGDVAIDDYASGYSHQKESARVGYYSVYLNRYHVQAEVTSTLRCASYLFTFNKGDRKKLLMDLSKANDRISDWAFQVEGPQAFSGAQLSRESIYFYAESNYPIDHVDSLPVNVGRRGSTMTKNVPLITFEGTGKKAPLAIKIGFSYVSVEHAKMNLEAEIGTKSFADIHQAAVQEWEETLSKITVTGGTEEEKGMFYSCLYRSLLWPVLRSDVDGSFTAPNGSIVNPGHRYYTTPSYWDDYRNKLVLLGMLSPDVAADVISSDIVRGQNSGFMPIFFHGDHASVFVAGSYLRGIRNFDVKEAYRLILHNATEENQRARPFLNAFNTLGYVPELDLENPIIDTPANTGVTRTLEYSYDDYAVALMAKELGDNDNYEMLMGRTKNYKNVFDASTGFMRGRTAAGTFVKAFDPYHPYYHFQFREANAWQSMFFAPHDPQGLIGLYPSPQAFEAKMDSLFTVPWRNYQYHNLTGFLGNYCHGNQPDHGFPYMYYFIGKQEKAQAVLNTLMHDYYGMGPNRLALAGMDDAGEMSAWYVFNAIGLYTFSPADPEYMVTVPLFDNVRFTLGDTSFQVVKQGTGTKITGIAYDGKPLDGYVISHDDLLKGSVLEISTANPN